MGPPRLGSSEVSNRYSGNEWVRETREACGRWAVGMGEESLGTQVAFSSTGAHLIGVGCGCPLAFSGPQPVYLALSFCSVMVPLLSAPRGHPVRGSHEP